MSLEQRKYIRFLPQDSTFAALRSGFQKVGKVSNISIKGLAFSYLKDTAEKNSDPESHQVDIFLSEKKFYLPNLPCKIVYDIPDPAYDQNYGVKMYRCGLSFMELAEIQSELLESFINKHAVKIL